MTTRVLWSILESPTHPDFSALYRRLDMQEEKFLTMRKAMAQLKRQAPDVVVAEFFYGYANNYAGVNISNLDVFLFGLQRYAPGARVVVLVQKKERQYVDALNRIFPLYGVLEHPVDSDELARLLKTAPSR